MYVKESKNKKMEQTRDWQTIAQLPVFVNKDLLEHSPAHLFIHYLQLLWS